jgi:probable rRNA maturation factor
VRIIIKNLQKKIPVYPKRIKKAILSALSSEGIKRSGEITVSFVSDAKIKHINSHYLRKNQVTDVISFDLSEKHASNRLCADIVISAPQAARNARAFKTNLAHELTLYALHGALHLFGYDDRNQKDRLIMQKKQEELLKKNAHS